MDPAKKAKRENEKSHAYVIMRPCMHVLGWPTNNWQDLVLFVCAHAFSSYIS
jgi:hypothetical protein